MILSISTTELYEIIQNKLNHLTGNRRIVYFSNKTKQKQPSTTTKQNLMSPFLSVNLYLTGSYFARFNHTIGSGEKKVDWRQWQGFWLPQNMVGEWQRESTYEIGVWKSIQY